MWRSISAPTSHLQIVPEFSEEEAKAKAEKEKAEKIESENTDLLLKLMQQVHKPALNSGQNSNKTCPGPGPIKVPQRAGVGLTLKKRCSKNSSKTKYYKYI